MLAQLRLQDGVAHINDIVEDDDGRPATERPAHHAQCFTPGVLGFQRALHCDAAFVPLRGCCLFQVWEDKMQELVPFDVLLDLEKALARLLVVRTDDLDSVRRIATQAPQAERHGDA